MIWGHTGHKNRAIWMSFLVQTLGTTVYIYIYIIYSTYWFPKFGLPVGATEIHPTWHQKLHLDDVDG